MADPGMIKKAIKVALKKKPPAPEVGPEPLYYVDRINEIRQRPVKRSTGTTMGFIVCIVQDGVDPQEVCDILNRGEPATDEDGVI